MHLNVTSWPSDSWWTGVVFKLGIPDMSLDTFSLKKVWTAAVQSGSLSPTFSPGWRLLTTSCWKTEAHTKKFQNELPMSSVQLADLCSRGAAGLSASPVLQAWLIPSKAGWPSSGCYCCRRWRRTSSPRSPAGANLFWKTKKVCGGLLTSPPKMKVIVMDSNLFENWV